MRKLEDQNDYEYAYLGNYIIFSLKIRGINAEIETKHNCEEWQRTKPKAGRRRQFGGQQAVPREQNVLMLWIKQYTGISEFPLVSRAVDIIKQKSILQGDPSYCSSSYLVDTGLKGEPAF